MPDPLPPNSVIGIVGGGQLGRMLAGAAQNMGLRTRIWATSNYDPAMQISDDRVRAPLTCPEAARRFVSGIRSVTYEFENIPLRTLKTISDICPIRPGLRSLEISSDRWKEKNFVRSLGINCAPFEAIKSPHDLVGAVRRLGFPLLIKSARLGYDGRGQKPVSGNHELESASVFVDKVIFESVRDCPESSGTPPLIVEKWIDFSKEFSVILARDTSGNHEVFPIGSNSHKNGILRECRVPGQIPRCAQEQSIEWTLAIANQLDHVGVLTVEFFLCQDGSVLLNELAPRVHNSGHWTTFGCGVSQFEQHVRAICGWPLRSPKLLRPTRMINLLGRDIDEWMTWIGMNDSAVTLYGKAEARELRKMGHINRPL